MNFNWRWRWLNWIQATFLKSFLLHQKKNQLDFSLKIEVHSSAWFGWETFQLGSTQLRKSQLKLITTSYVLLELAIMWHPFVRNYYLAVKFSFSEKATKIRANPPYGFDIYLVNIRRMAQIFVAFSEKLNFTVALSCKLEIKSAS